MAEKYRWKGKFVKEKFHDAILQRIENGKRRKKVKIEAETIAEDVADEQSVCVEGNS